jgi:hypothetical protein
MQSVYSVPLVLTGNNTALTMCTNGFGQWSFVVIERFDVNSEPSFEKIKAELSDVIGTLDNAD